MNFPDENKTETQTVQEQEQILVEHRSSVVNGLVLDPSSSGKSGKSSGTDPSLILPDDPEGKIGDIEAETENRNLQNASDDEAGCCCLQLARSNRKLERRSSAQIAIRMYNFRWKKSRVQIRLGLLLVIALLSVPYNAHTLYVYLTTTPAAPAPGSGAQIRPNFEENPIIAGANSRARMRALNVTDLQWQALNISGLDMSKLLNHFFPPSPAVDIAEPKSSKEPKGHELKPKNSGHSNGSSPRFLEPHVGGDAANSSLEENNVELDSEEEVEEVKCYDIITEATPVLENSRYWIEGITLSSIGFIGVLGNLVSIHILRKEPMNKSSFDTLLIHLLVCDTLLLVFFLIDSVTMVQEGDMPKWYISLYPYLLHPGKAISLSATVYMVVAVAADRQRAICHPMLYRPSPQCSTTLVILAAAAANLPRFFEFYLVYDKGSVSDFWTTDLNEDPRYIKWSSYNELFASIVLPLVGLCYYNYKIYARIKLSTFIDLGRYVGGRTLATSNSEYPMGPVTSDRDCCTAIDRNEEIATPKVRLVSCGGLQRNSSAPALASATINQEDREDGLLSPLPPGKIPPPARPFQQKREKSTAILLAIIIIFLACHMLRFIVQTYKVFSSPLHGGQKLFQHCHALGRLHVPALLLICGNINHMLLVVNSSVNMIIYVCLGRRFRNHLVHLATGHCGCAFFCSCSVRSSFSTRQIPELQNNQNKLINKSYYQRRRQSQPALAPSCYVVTPPPPSMINTRYRSTVTRSTYASRTSTYHLNKMSMKTDRIIRERD